MMVKSESMAKVAECTAGTKVAEGAEGMVSPELARRVRKARRSRMAVRAILGLELVIVAIPIFVIVVWAFSNSWPWPDLLPQEFTLRGVESVFSANGGKGLDSLWLSIGIAIAVAVLTTAIAAMGCRAIAHYRWRGKNVFEFLTILPFIIPSTVFAMGVQIVFLSIGLGRTVLGVILAHSIIALPYAMIILADVTKAAGIQREEAARSLGANPWQMLCHVTIPSIMPGIISSLSMCYIMSFSQYFLTLLIGGGKVNPFVLVLFPYLSGADRTIACAYSLVFLVVTFVVFLAFEVLLRRFGVKEREGLYE